MRWRVVCTLGDTMLTFPPTKVLSRVDLPTFGLPAKAMKPQHVSGSGFIQRFQETRSRILLRTAAAAPRPLQRQIEVRDVGAYAKGLPVLFSANGEDFVFGQFVMPRLQKLLQPRFGILEALGVRKIAQTLPVQGENHFPAGIEPRIQVDGAEQGFHGIGQDGMTAEAPALELPLPQFD